MSKPPQRSYRAFKTAWFSKAAKKAQISDGELCAAMAQVVLGQADDLGGGVYKKRLNKNMHRSILVAKAGQFWVYEYLFAKKDIANIPANKLADLRQLAKSYEALAKHEIEILIEKQFWTEICHDNQA